MADTCHSEANALVPKGNVSECLNHQAQDDPCLQTKPNRIYPPPTLLPRSSLSYNHLLPFSTILFAHHFLPTLKPIPRSCGVTALWSVSNLFFPSRTRRPNLCPGTSPRPRPTADTPILAYALKIENLLEVGGLKPMPTFSLTGWLMSISSWLPTCPCPRPSHLPSKNIEFHRT